MVKAHLAVPPQEGEQKQGGNHDQPEGQIQHKGQPPPPDAAAKRPHQVIYQPQNDAHHDPLSYQRPLGQHICGHGQRSSRAKKPPFPAA